MPLDPRTPVIAGVGQVTHRPQPGDPSTWTEPLTLMADALSRAGDDASATRASRSALLDRIDVLTAIPSFVWVVRDAARAVADTLGLAPRSTRVTFPGGTVPQSALFDAATRIAAGELDVAVIVGAEAMKSRDLARRVGERPAWHTQDESVAAADVAFEVTTPAVDDDERAAGLALPVHTYALFEHAIRRARGLSRDAHSAHLDALAARMHSVAARNDGSWLGEHVVDAVTTASSSNRMISFPYTKLLTSNVVVDMGAAIVICSLSAARTAGVPDDQLVFPQRGVYAKEQWLVSTRQTIGQSLAMRACAVALFGEHPPSVDELALLDLYSCFPSAIQLGADALGIDVHTDERAPTVTGGMTFFGGPGNNYVSHSLATMAERLRAQPAAIGLVTALGWYASTHSWGTYSTSPPDVGFLARDVQATVDAVPLRAVDVRYEGEATVESYTVGHDRGAGPTRVIASLLTPDGARRILANDDPDVAAAFEAADPLGGIARVRAGTLTLR